jgi:hypothetical protein
VRTSSNTRHCIILTYATSLLWVARWRELEGVELYSTTQEMLVLLGLGSLNNYLICGVSDEERRLDFCNTNIVLSRIFIWCLSLDDHCYRNWEWSWSVFQDYAQIINELSWVSTWILMMGSLKLEAAPHSVYILNWSGSTYRLGSADPVNLSTICSRQLKKNPQS